MHPTWHHVDSHEFCDSTFVPPSFAAANDSRMKTAMSAGLIVIIEKSYTNIAVKYFAQNIEILY